MTAYHDDLEYLEGQFRLLDLRIKRHQAEEVQPWDDDLGTDELFEQGLLGNASAEASIDQQLAELAETHQQRLEAAHAEGRTFALERLAERHELDSFETELLLLLVYRQFVDTPLLHSGHALLSILAGDRLELMRLTRALRASGRLRRNNLILSDQLGTQTNLLEAGYELPAEVSAELTGSEPLQATGNESAIDPSYRGYLEFWFQMVALMERRHELVANLRHEDPLFGERLVASDCGGAEQIDRQIVRIEGRIAEYGRRDPKSLAQFPLERIAAEQALTAEERAILVILLRNSLGLCDAFMGCDGKKLLGIISRSETEMIRNRQLLYKKSKLRTAELVRQERGWPGQNFLDCEYELPEPIVRTLLGHLSDSGDAAEAASETGDDALFKMSDPRYSLDDVILDPAKKKRLVVTLQQEQHRELIFNEWGFEKTMPGRSGLAILLSGPPGTGKTMLAEAIADHLGKKLFVVDYSQVQNMFVGETEKRIVNAFKQAREADAVLVWDEADAMFYSRDIATHSWENRDVNVILQEIEGHQGVVVLTTNRKHGLDVALDRRMGLKLELGNPELSERKEIWRRHLPESAPLADDVALDRLAEKYEVSGGQIRNAVLAAARSAAVRGGDQPRISMADMVDAIEAEIDAGWSGVGKGRLGF